jgi:hypothetical protein
VQIEVAVDKAAVDSRRSGDRRHSDSRSVGSQLGDRVVDLQAASGGVAAA